MAKTYRDTESGELVTIGADGLPVAASFIEDDGDAFTADMWNYTPTDIAKLDAAGAARAGVVGGAAALGDVARFAAVALPTAEDKQNDKRLDELAKHKGLTDGERADIDEQAMRGVKAMGRETSARMGDQLASSGQASAASLQRARASSQDALNRASIAAADIGIRENREQVKADRTEEQERIAQRSMRAEERRSAALSALGSMMMAVAPAVAAAAVPSKPTESQFNRLKDATNTDGSPKYPGLMALTYDDAIALSGAKLAAALRPDGAVQPR